MIIAFIILGGLFVGVILGLCISSLILAKRADNQIEEFLKHGN